MKYFQRLLTIAVCLSGFILHSQNSGNLDLQFGTNGTVTTSFTGLNEGRAVANQADGKIVLVGTTTYPGNQQIRVMRYLFDGSIDSSFGTNGSYLYPGTYSFGRAVAIRPNGKIVAVGTDFGSFSSENIVVVQLNPNGTLDASFGNNGIKIFPMNSAQYVETVVLQDDGKIVVGGTFASAGELDVFAARIDTNGVLDNTFGIQGLAKVDILGTNQFGKACLIQNDGKIVLIGTDMVVNDGNIMVSRMNIDGSMDASFGTNGTVTTDVTPSANDTGTSGVLQDDGKILVVGDTKTGALSQISVDFCALRYTTDGTLDTSFNGTGIVVADFDGGQDVGTSIAFQLNGSIVVAGHGISNPSGDSTSRFSMIRYLPEGSIDNQFGTNGKVMTTIGQYEDLCYAMTLPSDTLILLVGESKDAFGYSDFTLARYSNGTIGFGELQIEANDLSVYPNPIGSNSVLTYSLKQNDRVSIDIYDQKGARVQSILNDENQSKGKKSINLNLKSDLPNGIYTIRVKSASSVRSIEIYR